ncbi:MAG: 1-aminocyclopropane-1-carboxylate deaminase/D-cysteine desulfhydrase [Flavobacteriales bacterium]|nr:1-aminocyclopropane-1-carboxylate deaminase/D-cysteine desulfhydrase [Flavobacteriales bacterium]
MLIPSPIQRLNLDQTDTQKVELWVKRDDLIHDELSGNKYRKLKYNLEELISKNIKKVITFGGAHSNHIIATAYLCNQLGIKSSALIRGERTDTPSPTLKKASQLGMHLEYISREEYRLRNVPIFLSSLQESNPDAFIIPEGGANELGVKGCEEIIVECQKEVNFDYITVDCGTGATLAGMVRQLKHHQRAIGIQVLKGHDFITNEVKRLNGEIFSNFEVWTNYHFGGYAKYKSELIEFMRSFYIQTGIKLDPVYTGKQFFAVFDQIKKGYFPEGSKIVLIHTGGLQGLEGFEERYGIKIY